MTADLFYFGSFHSKFKSGVHLITRYTEYGNCPSNLNAIVPSQQNHTAADCVDKKMVLMLYVSSFICFPEAGAGGGGVHGSIGKNRFFVLIKY